MTEPSAAPAAPENSLFPTLEAFVNHGFEHARDIIYGGGEFHTSFIVQHDGGTDYLVTPWSNMTEREAIIAHVRRYIKQRNAIRYALLSEAWVSTQKRGEPLVKPSDNPLRREILFVLGVERGGRTFIRQAEIVTNDAGKRTLDEEADLNQMSFSGTMTELFDDAPDYSCGYTRIEEIPFEKITGTDTDADTDE